jgi:endonuclease G
MSQSPSAVAPILPIVILQPNPMLEIAFDRRTKNPCYVLEKIDCSSPETHQQSSTAASRRTRKETFYEEQFLHPYHRSRNSYYKNSGFDRGHLAPVADFTSVIFSNNSSSKDTATISTTKEEDEENDETQQLIKDTFNLCNISPQYPTFNRRVWANVEQFTRNIIKEELRSNNKKINNYYTAYIVTGPIYLPSSTLPKNKNNEKPLYQYSYLGIGTPPSIVSVPTHFFKVIAFVSDNNRVEKAAAFVLPNQEFSCGTNTMSLDSFLVTFEDLEAVTGLEFFHNMFGKTTMTSSSVTIDVDAAEEDDDMYHNVTTAAAPTTTIRKLFFDMVTRDLQNHHSNNSNSINPIIESSSSILAVIPSPKSQQQRKIKKAFYKSKEDSIQHLCQNHRCCIDLQTGKHLVKD